MTKLWLLSCIPLGSLGSHVDELGVDIAAQQVPEPEGRAKLPPAFGDRVAGLQQAVTFLKVGLQETEVTWVSSAPKRDLPQKDL